MNGHVIADAIYTAAGSFMAMLMLVLFLVADRYEGLDWLLPPAIFALIASAVMLLRADQHRRLWKRAVDG